jgi:hypothetical protein
MERGIKHAGEVFYVDTLFLHADRSHSRICTFAYKIAWPRHLLFLRGLIVLFITPIGMIKEEALNRIKAIVAMS